MFLGSMDAESIRYLRDDFRKQHRLLGNLSLQEMGELEGYLFDLPPSIISKEIRMYYLYVKSVNPSSAQHLLTRTQSLLERGVYSVDDVEDLCRVLSPYYAGFVLHYEMEAYSIDLLSGRFKRESLVD